MMDGAQQSDAGVVAMKAANKGARVPAEPLERRAAAERNPRRTGTVRTQSRGAVSPGAERIRQFVKEKPGERLTALLHHITPEALREAYLALKRDAAPGVDGMTWREYGDGLDERLLDLHGRVRRGAYRAKPVRRVEIAKLDGGVRPLGIASLEDKIVQRAVVEQILNPIYESEFYGFSYGFRPGRSAHDALDALAYAVDRRKVGWIVEVDIREYFDSIDREQLMQFLEMRIGDRRVLRLIRKWLNAGVIEAGLEVDVARGTPQGAVISPLLANVYLHHVLDDWFAREWRPREVWGEAYIVRYADDFVLGFQYRRDAERFMEAVRERFAAFGLGVHPEKTRLVEFGRFAEANRRERGEGRPETFDFLGFTHYCRTTHEGRFGLGRKPVAKRMRRTLQAIKAELRRRMHADPVATGAVAWAGTARVAGLLRGADERAVAVTVRAVSEAALDASPPPEVTAGLLPMGASRRPLPEALAPRRHPAPVAVGAICRQDSRREPDALARTSGSVRGAPGNRRPYREPHLDVAGQRLCPLNGSAKMSSRAGRCSVDDAAPWCPGGPPAST